MATVNVTTEMNFNDLMDACWGGALDTLKIVEDEGKEEELMELLAEQFDGSDLTSINDYLWFEDEDILSTLGIDYSEDNEDDDE